MTLILDLSEELETRLRSAARARGTDEAEAARQVLEISLPPIEGQPKMRATGRGKFAHLLTDSETFAREKQEEIRREEAGW